VRVIIIIISSFFFLNSFAQRPLNTNQYLLKPAEEIDSNTVNFNSDRRYNPVSTKKAFQILDSIYNFSSFIDYDTISTQWQMQYVLCMVWEVDYKIYFLKNGMRNLNYHIHLNGEFSQGFNYVEENGAKWQYHENMISADLNREKVNEQNGKQYYTFEDLSTDKKTYLKNPNKYVSFFIMNKGGGFQIKFNEKEVYGIEPDFSKMLEITKELLNFDNSNYTLKQTKTKDKASWYYVYLNNTHIGRQELTKNDLLNYENSSYTIKQLENEHLTYNLYYKSAYIGRWQFFKNAERMDDVDVDRYTTGSKLLSVLGYYPILDLNTTPLTSKRKAAKKAKALYTKFKKHANVINIKDWPSKPKGETILSVKKINISKTEIPKLDYVLLYQSTFKNKNGIARKICLNANTGEVVFNQFKY